MFGQHGFENDPEQLVMYVNRDLCKYKTKMLKIL